MPKVRSFLCILHASLILHGTDSLPAKMHSEKVEGEVYTVLRRLIPNLLLSFLIDTADTG